MEQNKNFNLEYRVLAADGLQRWVRSIGSMSSTVDPAGRQIRELHGVAIDFTERKHIEEELRRTNCDLEEFAYAAAHDLQEPLRNIAMSLQLAKAKNLIDCDPEALELLDMAVDNSRRMETMIKALLSFSRALDTAGEAVPLVHANFALRLALENLKTSIAETHAEITSDPLAQVAMRQFHLLQIFQNLLSNALKYRSQAPPKIHVGARERGAECVLTVSDNGIGIPPAYYDRVFGVFKRLKLNDAPGAGIGLALCKRIVEHYDGRIWIEPNPEQGVTFAFSVPAVLEKKSG